MQINCKQCGTQVPAEGIHLCPNQHVHLFLKVLDADWLVDGEERAPVVIE